MEITVDVGQIKQRIVILSNILELKNKIKLKSTGFSHEGFQQQIVDISGRKDFNKTVDEIFDILSENDSPAFNVVLEMLNLCLDANKYANLTQDTKICLADIDDKKIEQSIKTLRTFQSKAYWTS
ncbi:MAG: hypothetical protein PHC75_07485 [Burkholderiales bacterium]|nr:hypothetical protein [Burkholderiales bacterium]